MTKVKLTDGTVLECLYTINAEGLLELIFPEKTYEFVTEHFSDNEKYKRLLFLSDGEEDEAEIVGETNEYSKVLRIVVDSSMTMLILDKADLESEVKALKESLELATNALEELIVAIME